MKATLRPAFPIVHQPAPQPRRRPWAIGLAVGSGALLISVTAASAQFTISVAPGVFTPSFRGAADTTYFGWGDGGWDGNVDTAPPNVDIINGVPSINPGALPGPLLMQAVAADIVSSSNNIYSNSGVSQINSVGLTLAIPTSGVVGTGFTTIIIQGLGLNGTLFGLPSGLDTFSFGSINGVAPTYVSNNNNSLATQWWAKWELPGNAASYNVSIVGFDVDLTPGVNYPVSVTEMMVDTQWSSAGFAPDTAVATPEPSSALMLLSGTALLGLLRRRPALPLNR